MPVSERARHHAYTRLTETVGSDAADVIMELLPIHPPADLVTRTDFQAGIIRLQGEMAEQRADLQGEMADLRSELRGEMAELRSELRGEMANLSAELRGEMADLGGKLQGEMGRIYRWGAAVVAANAIATITALLT